MGTWTNDGKGGAQVFQLPNLVRILTSETIPPPEGFIELGRELLAARLDYFIESNFPPERARSNPEDCAALLLWHSTWYAKREEKHGVTESPKGIQAVIDRVRALDLWLYVRDSLTRFANLAAVELRSRVPNDVAEGEYSDWLPVAEWATVFDLHRNTTAKRLKALAAGGKAELQSRQRWRIRLSALQQDQRERYDTIMRKKIEAITRGT